MWFSCSDDLKLNEERKYTDDDYSFFFSPKNDNQSESNDASSDKSGQTDGADAEDNESDESHDSDHLGPSGDDQEYEYDDYYDHYDYYHDPNYGWDDLDPYEEYDEYYYDHYYDYDENYTHGENDETDTTATIKKIKRTNSASTQLGLTVLLHPDQDEHVVGLNSYVGYKVLRFHALRLRPHFPFIFEGAGPWPLKLSWGAC